MSYVIGQARAMGRRFLKRAHVWDAYREFRELEEARRPLGPEHDRWGHDQQVRRTRVREKAAAVDASVGMGTSSAQLDEFFASFELTDPGVPLIRVGPAHDGGYLLPDDLDGIAACFSPGVAQVIGFDLALADRGIPVHMIDASVPSLPQEHPLIDFEPLFLGSRTKPGWTSLDDWVERRAPDGGDLVLQMDIEGAEWGVLGSASDDVLQRVRIIVMEMHDLHRLASPSGLAAISTAFDRLLAHFHLVYVHENNHEYPIDYLGHRLHPVVEATWVRKDRVPSPRRRDSLTHPLDAVNAPEMLQHPLDPAWR